MVKIQKEKKPRKPRATLKQKQSQAVVVNIHKPTRGRPKKVIMEKRSSPKEKKPESNISFHPVISMPQYSIDSTLKKYAEANSQADEIESLKRQLKILNARLQPELTLRPGAKEKIGYRTRYVGDNLDDVSIARDSRLDAGHFVDVPLSERVVSEHRARLLSTPKSSHITEQSRLRPEWDIGELLHRSASQRESEGFDSGAPSLAGSEAGSILSHEELPSRLHASLGEQGPFLEEAPEPVSVAPQKVKASKKKEQTILSEVAEAPAFPVQQQAENILSSLKGEVPEPEGNYKAFLIPESLDGDSYRTKIMSLARANNFRFGTNDSATKILEKMFKAGYRGTLPEEITSLTPSTQGRKAKKGK